MQKLCGVQKNINKKILLLHNRVVIVGILSVSQLFDLWSCCALSAMSMPEILIPAMERGCRNTGKITL